MIRVYSSLSRADGAGLTPPSEISHLLLSSKNLLPPFVMADCRKKKGSPYLFSPSSKFGRVWVRSVGSGPQNTNRSSVKLASALGLVQSSAAKESNQLSSPTTKPLQDIEGVISQSAVAGPSSSSESPLSSKNVPDMSQNGFVPPRNLAYVIQESARLQELECPLNISRVPSLC